MAKKNVYVPDEWIVVADAGPAFKTASRYTSQIVAFRIHRDSTATMPVAEGAVHLGATGINKAEYLAVIQGLRVLADRMYVYDWDRDPVNVVTDNIFVVNQATDRWEAGELGWHRDRLNDVCSELEEMTGEGVYFWHADEGQSAGADSLARRFRDTCDMRQRAEWHRLRLLERWAAVNEHLREQHHPICAAAVSSARVVAYDGKVLTLSLRHQGIAEKLRDPTRKRELREAIQAVIGSAPREIRLV